jgi:hypothetical protein
MEVKAKKRRKKRSFKYKTETVTFLSTFIIGMSNQLPGSFPRETIVYLAAPVSYFTQFISLKVFGIVDLAVSTYRVRRYVKELEEERVLPGKAKSRQLEIDMEICEYRSALRERRIRELNWRK